MTIMDFTRQELTEYPKISEFPVDEDIHTDFTMSDPGYGLSNNGDNLVKEDLLDNQTRRYNFAVYTVTPPFTDYCRLANSSLLLELGHRLGSLPEEYGLIANIGNQKLEIRFLKTATPDAMVIQPTGGTVNDDILYQIQIQVACKMESGEF